MQIQQSVTTRARSIASAGLLALFTALAAGSAETNSDAGKVASEPTAYNLTAEQIYADFEANQIAADTKYKDKVVTVTGAISGIGKDVASNAYVTIGGMGLDGVQCLFPKGQESAISQLSKGQSITAKGKVSGKMGNVIVRNCTLQ